jgi:ribosomal protein S18 acetylase RimI-like enzyme
MNNFIFRSATIADKAQLSDLGLTSYGRFKDVLLEEHWAKLKALLSSEDLYSGLLKVATGFVCERNEKIVGMAFLIPSGNPTEIFQSDWSYIRMVGVDPHFSGQGIGKRLTEMCIDHAKKTNEKIIALHTSEFMDAARHVYENLGFYQAKELTPRYGKRYWLYIRELED